MNYALFMYRYFTVILTRFVCLITVKREEPQTLVIVWFIIMTGIRGKTRFTKVYQISSEIIFDRPINKFEQNNPLGHFGKNSAKTLAQQLFSK